MKKENLKYLLILAIVLLLAYAVGYFVGVGLGIAEDSSSFQSKLHEISQLSIVLLPYVLAIVSAAAILLMLVLFYSCRKMYCQVKAEPENESLLDKLEMKLSTPLFTSNLFMILEIFLFFWMLLEMIENGLTGGIYIIAMAMFFLALCISIVVQKLTFDMEKDLNPEKRGNFLDLRFSKKWMDSSDEAQKMIAYQAGFCAFKGVNACCAILMALSIVVAILFDTGMYPMLVIAVLWAVNVGSYMMKAAKLER